MDEQSTTYRIPGGLFRALGAVWLGTPSPISPLRSGGVNTAASAIDLATLQALGLCDAQGHVLPAARPVLDVLGNASSFVRVYLSGCGSVKEFVTYRDALGGSASLANISGDFDVECPASTQTLVAIVTQMTGSSAMRSVDFEASLSGSEAIALAAAMDLQRSVFLHALADGVQAGAVDLFGQQVAAVCESRTPGNQGLCNHFLDLAGSTGIPQNEIYRALMSLTEKTLMVQGPKAIRLSDPLLQVAEHLLVIEQALTLTAGACAGNGSVAVVGFSCLQTGVHDLLYIEVVDDAVELRMESAAAIVEHVRAFLEDPAVMEGLSVVDAALACSTCHKPSVVDAKFCGNCGAIMHPEPVPLCTNCGTALLTASRFCEKCGQPVGSATALRAVAPPDMVACVVCGKDGRVVAASGYSVANDPEVAGDDDRVDADMVALFLKRPDRHESEGVMLARWKHLQYCVRCQHAWLDNTSAEPVEIVDVDALLMS